VKGKAVERKGEPEARRGGAKLWKQKAEQRREEAEAREEVRQ